MANSDQAGIPSFRNVLSAGDRNTLGLAFFFASLERDPDLPNRILFVDDPMTSLDEHRLLATAQELRRLSQTAAQLVVLSHDKSFLFTVWDNAQKATRSGLQVVRERDGSVIKEWNVNDDIVTEHDKRHAALKAFLENGAGNAREIAESLRPILEKFLRVAYPDAFRPGDLLGTFVSRCEAALVAKKPILSATDLQELNDIKEYANRFHHDTNEAAATAQINEAELTSFGRRTLEFTRRV